MTRFAFLIEPPFCDRMSDGTVTGCDVELARTVLALAGAEDFQPAETEFAQLLPGLVDGRWRMTTGLFATAERRRLAAFSRPIWALPDGLLVRKGNPLRLTGYRSLARTPGSILAVVRDQIQHRSAVALGVPQDRIQVFETYASAASAILNGRAQAYASVARAHGGFIDGAGALDLEVVTIGAAEKEPAFGAFAFNLDDDAFRQAVDEALGAYLGSLQHRAMMKGYGFSDADIDLVA
ncbi:ectoine/hydroxyectoine ABC transporter substrate-binding protein EhuB [Labrys miyagiensis]|uniref:Ectoine/hydroxyectoine ABC transporter substrate-binding protein EhuB n=1 Tax=Labrys miyagiensis TaxID=346912 RepID=A0ABQ6CGD2_9HYPH|nr:transporter substrate-binding domain-containing protein [Labrys miyagiensis]GLS17905.1 ectoine/hydroxyectoine ABC transporter substrate-binding protein EhuB [Labrys miyagiensis]